MIERWHTTWRGMERPPPEGVFEKLCAAYSESHRHYHTLEHLRECWVLYDALAARPGKTHRVELALWFHDVVYDTTAHDNELQSAAWAARALSSARVSPEDMHRVTELILATRHRDEGQLTPEAELLVDIDLAILGAAPQRFAEYEAQIRSEYGWVPEAQYREARARILKQFAARPSIFQSRDLRERLEEPARRNLAASIARLS